MEKQKGIIRKGILRKIDELRSKVGSSESTRNVDILLEVSSNLDKCLYKWDNE